MQRCTALGNKIERPTWPRASVPAASANSSPSSRKLTSVTICREFSDADQIIKSEHGGTDRRPFYARERPQRLFIDSNATLELSNGSANQTVFNGQLGTLKLDAPTAFTGSIYDITLGDTIDLVGITASSATYSGTTLTINETNGQQLIYNNVSGSVAGDIVTVASDNNGGTLVYWAQPRCDAAICPQLGHHADIAATTGPTGCR